LSRRFEVALGALLHDIGKIAERAGLPAPPAELRRNFAPDGANLHAAYTAWALGRSPFGEVLSFAARHHGPASALDAVVAVANRFAASRAGAAHPDEGQLPAGEARRRRLAPILARVRREGAVPPREPSHLPLRQLSFRIADLDPAPGDGPASADLARDEYLHGLWDEVESGLAALPADARLALPGALALLERLGSRVPAAPAEAHADVSLYDHSRLAAALATALYIEVVEPRGEADRGLAKELDAQDAARFQLYAGELRGGDGLFAGLSPAVGPAALTGRSAWLCLLTDALAGSVLSALDLPATSLLYTAGTRFLLLLPHGAAGRLSAIASEIDLAMLEIGRGRLAYAWGAAPMALSDLGGARLSERWAVLEAEVESSRQRPFGDLLTRSHGHESLFGLGDLPRGRCAACGDDLVAPDIQCGACVRYEALGRAAARARAFARTPFEAQARTERALRDAGLRPAGSVGFAPLGVAYLALSELPEGPHSLEPQVTLLATAPEPAPGVGLRVGLAPPPRRGGEAPCATLASVARGARRWGVLMADLDDLAGILERGFPEGERSLARTLALSRAVHHFFAGYAASLSVRDDAVHVVRTGGDALWAVAPWDHLPGLALSLRDALHRFAGGNATLGLCAGIAVAPETVPVGEVLAEAAAKLRRGKAHTRLDDRRKDAVYLLGASLAWADAALAAEMAQALADAAPALRARLLDRLRRVAASARRLPAPQTLEEVGAAMARGRWTWRMVARLGELARAAGPERALVERFQRALCEDDWEGRRHERPIAETLAIAVRWCGLLTTTEQGHERRAAG
jgi:CRISPR-associated protein Csm1